MTLTARPRRYYRCRSLPFAARARPDTRMAAGFGGRSQLEGRFRVLRRGGKVHFIAGRIRLTSLPTPPPASKLLHGCEKYPNAPPLSLSLSLSLSLLGLRYDAPRKKLALKIDKESGDDQISNFTQ